MEVPFKHNCLLIANLWSGVGVFLNSLQPVEASLRRKYYYISNLSWQNIVLHHLEKFRSKSDLVFKNFKATYIHGFENTSLFFESRFKKSKRGNFDGKSWWRVSVSSLFRLGERVNNAFVIIKKSHSFCINLLFWDKLNSSSTFLEWTAPK